MNKYVIKFSHVEESEYTAIVEAESYEEAMDIFGEVVYEKSKKLNVEYC